MPTITEINENKITILIPIYNNKECGPASARFMWRAAAQDKPATQTRLFLPTLYRGDRRAPAAGDAVPLLDPLRSWR